MTQLTAISCTINSAFHWCVVCVCLGLCLCLCLCLCLSVCLSEAFNMTMS